MSDPIDTTDITVMTDSREPESAARRGLNRRGFLGAAGALSAAAFLAACGSDDEGGNSPTTASGDDPTTTTTEGGADSTTTTEGGADSTTTTAAPGGGNTDLVVGAFAASLEVLAVNTYMAALEAAGTGDLGEVPPAVGEFATTAMAHHQAALDAWNGVLTEAGEPEVTEPPADLKATVDEMFAEVMDIGGVAKLALLLEDIASATYLAAIGGGVDEIPVLTSEGAIALASMIQPIDMQHAAVLHFALGEYPVPDVFAKTDNAAVPA